MAPKTNPFLDILTNSGELDDSFDSQQSLYGYKSTLGEQAVLSGGRYEPFARNSMLNPRYHNLEMSDRNELRMTKEFSYNSHIAALSTMTPDQLEDLQYRLWYSGAYSDEVYKDKRMPSGLLDAETIQAYSNVLTIASREVGRGRSMADVLDMMAVERSDIVNSALMDDEGLNEFNAARVDEVRTSDPAYLGDLVDKIAVATTGKKIDDAKKSEIVNSIIGSEKTQQTTTIAAADNARRQNAATASGTGASAPVEGEAIDKFMASLRKMESGGNYQAVGPSTKYGRATGAYQFLDSTWGGYGGYKSAKDAPPAIQDERARQLMSAYYKRFGDWKLVAVAWHAGPGTAARMQRTGGSAGTADVNMSTDKYAASVVAGMGGEGPGGSYPIPVTSEGGTPAVTPTTIVETTNVDPESRIEDMIRQTDPVAAGAHDAVSKYGLFAKILGGG